MKSSNGIKQWAVCAIEGPPHTPVNRDDFAKAEQLLQLGQEFNKGVN